jgi:protoporphyrinogen IX oxidase
MSALASLYPWLKALHIVSVVAWMAGLLYLPRLFVYHAGVASGSDTSETFKVMERRLFNAIMTPAMIATYLFGIALAMTPGIIAWNAAWIWLKLVLVAGLTVFHLCLGAWRTEFAADNNRRTARFYRMVNELPTLLLIAIVVLVVVKPF